MHKAQLPNISPTWYFAFKVYIQRNNKRNNSNKKPNTMKANASLSENYNDRLSSNKGSFRSHVSNSFIIILLGILLMSAMSRPSYMSFQTAIQLLEPASAEQLKSLATKTHPTVYLTKGKTTTDKEGTARVAICDASSVDMLYKNDPALGQIELIKITARSFNDLPASIDLNQLEKLTNLKYLLVEFEYDACGGVTEDCFSSILEGFIQGATSQITVIYSHSISE